MNSKAWAVVIPIALSVLAAVAANGPKLIEVARGTWLFLLNLSSTAPLGLTSFLLAFGLAVASRPYMLRYLPKFKQDSWRHFLVDSIALVIGFGVMYAQLRTLNGALLGLLAGFAAPLLARLIAAAWGSTKPKASP